MRILFVSGELIGSAICHKLLKEGNEVKLYIHKPEWRRCLDSLVPKVEDWRSEIEWVGKEGLIIFDDVIFGNEQDRLRKLGYRVVGSSGCADRLESERSYFHEVLRKHGVNTLSSFDFNNASEATNFVMSNPDHWVIKQSSHLSSLNFIGENDNQKELIDILREYGRRKIAPIHIQKYVKGIEVGVARYFNGNDWVGPIEINHEHKRLYEGDKGPLTPEMGTILWYTNDDIRLFTETLEKIKPHLQEIGFMGDIDINCIVNEEGLWPLEATPRFGTPASEIHVELNKSPWVDFLGAIADGKHYDLQYEEGFGIAVSLSTPPFPFTPHIFDRIGKYIFDRNIIFDLDLYEDDIEHIHFEEVSKNKNGYYWSGTYGWVMHITAKAETINEAQEKVYRIVDKIKIPKMIYRRDIGDRVKNCDIPTLKSWGWL